MYRIDRKVSLGMLLLALAAPMLALAADKAAPAKAAAGSAADSGPIKVGRSLALTGALASYGQAKKVGGEAYIDRINREGGIRGRKIEMTTLDDKYDPKETVKNIVSMNGDIVALLGLFGVPTIAAALPTIEELKLPAIGLTSGAAVVRNPPRRYAFPVRASYADEADTIAAHFSSLDMKKVAIVRQANAYGASVAENMEASLQKIGLKSVVNIEMAVDGSDAKAVVKRLAASGDINMVFLAMLSGPAGIAIDEMRAANVLTGAGISSVSPVDTTVLTAKLKDRARGVAVSQVVPLTLETMPLVREYKRDLKALSGGEIPPSFYGLEGYIEARIMVEGMKRVTGPLTRESLVAALEALGEFDLGGMSVVYAPGKHQGLKYVDLTMISRGGLLVR